MPESDYAALVSTHYTPKHLVDAFDRVLQSWGLQDALLTPSALAPIDQFHVGGEASTVALAALAGVDSSTRILDIGGGFGGPARTLAATYGCSVVVLDLTEAYCQVGGMLTRRSGLSDHVIFRHSDALAIPFPDEAFDLVWTQHSSMNIADKQRLYAETYRVLRTGGKLALYEIMAGTEGDIHFPVPWARDASLSFLSSPDDIHTFLADAGFRTLQWEDLTDATVTAARAQSTPATSQTGLHLVLGDDFLERARNMGRNLAEHRTALIRAVLDRP